MTLSFNSSIEPIRCYACPLTIPPFETYIATDNRAFCLPCVQGILNNGTVAQWQAAVSERAKVLQTPVFFSDEDERGRFYLRDYENGRELIDVSYLGNVFDVDVQNKIGLPIVLTLTEKKRVEHPELTMESDG